jgi:hypothetical protein
MSTTITAGNATNGLAFSADSTGILELKTGTGAGTTALTISTAQVVSVPGNLSFNSGYGSSVVAYGCRAWVNFNGTGTVAIRASGNVTSITDNGTGDYTVNFTTAMPDANYSAVSTCGDSAAAAPRLSGPTSATAPTVSLYRLVTTFSSTNAAQDVSYVFVAFFR